MPAPHEAWLLLQYLSATEEEAAGWFMQEQVRPSPIKAVNELAGLYNDLPHWDVIKRALGCGHPRRR